MTIEDGRQEHIVVFSYYYYIVLLFVYSAEIKREWESWRTMDGMPKDDHRERQTNVSFVSPPLAEQ